MISTQTLQGSAFNGSAVDLPPLNPKATYIPHVSMMHADGGNTGSVNFPGPRGNNTAVTSYATEIGVILFDAEGRFTAGGVTSTGFVLNAIDPVTLETIATWTPPVNQTLIFTYMQMTMNDSQIVVPSKQGHIFVVRRDNTVEPPVFTTLRDIDLSPFLLSGEQLLNSMYDSNLNIWFTTGGIVGAGDAAQDSTTLGYVTPSNDVYVNHIPNQMVENGIAISNETIFVVTGPSGTANHTNATGYMYAFQQGCEEPITILWNSTYAAGDALKPGGFARGSGTTPTLLGQEYLAITDNDNVQVSMLIYRQARQDMENQLVCKVPIFQPRASAVDTGTIGHCDANGRCAAVAFNDYNGPAILLAAPADINGDWNNFTRMAPGMARVDVYANGTGCELVWENKVRVLGGGILSTETGLLYTYTQDAKLANEGVYEWYTEAVNWETGVVEWAIRVGAGGTYDSEARGNLLGPNGTLYQGTLDGIVAIQDVV
jgi:hypothetical protein